MHADIAKDGNAPMAVESLERIGKLHEIEARVRGRMAEERRTVRRGDTRPLVDDLFTWLESRLSLVSQEAKIAEVIRYGLKRRAGLEKVLNQGRLETDTNTVERAKATAYPPTY